MKNVIFLWFLIILLFLNYVSYYLYVNLNYFDNESTMTIKIYEVINNKALAKINFINRNVIIQLNKEGLNVGYELKIVGKLKNINFELSPWIVNFKNYFASQSIFYELKIYKILNVQKLQNKDPDIVMYFLYHLKINKDEVKILQSNNVIALFILSSIHASFLHKIFLKITHYCWIASLVTVLLFGYFSYLSSFYLITFKAFIVEIIFFLGLRWNLSKIYCHRLSSIFLFIFLSSNVVLNLGFWFSLILSEFIFYVSKKESNTLKSKFILNIKIQVLICFLAQIIVHIFNKNILIFNWFWNCLLAPFYIFLSITLLIGYFIPWENFNVFFSSVLFAVVKFTNNLNISIYDDNIMFITLYSMLILIFIMKFKFNKIWNHY